MEILGHMETLCLTLLRNSKLFSKATIGIEPDSDQIPLASSPFAGSTKNRETCLSEPCWYEWQNADREKVHWLNDLDLSTGKLRGKQRDGGGN